MPVGFKTNFFLRPSPDFDPSSWERDVILPRLSLLRSECGRRSRRRIEAEEEDPRLPRGYVSDPASGLAYCHVPKAASTFWLEKFARTLHPGMTQEEMEEILLKRGRKLNPFVLLHHVPIVLKEELLEQQIFSWMILFVLVAAISLLVLLLLLLRLFFIAKGSRSP